MDYATVGGHHRVHDSGNASISGHDTIGKGRKVKESRSASKVSRWLRTAMYLHWTIPLNEYQEAEKALGLVRHDASACVATPRRHSPREKACSAPTDSKRLQDEDAAWTGGVTMLQPRSIRGRQRLELGLRDGQGKLGHGDDDDRRSAHLPTPAISPTIWLGSRVVHTSLTPPRSTICWRSSR